MTIGWGIVGPGNHANNAMAPAIEADSNSELVAVVSRDQSRARALAERHGATWAGTSYEDMLARQDVDAVLITTPNSLHPEQVIAAARAGKHVLCDKPLAITVEEAVAGLDACREAGVRIGVTFQTRHHTCFQDVREVIASGEIGEIVSVHIDGSPGRRGPGGWRTDTALAGLGSTNNIAVHLHDVVRFILNAEVTEVSALFETGRETAIEVLPLVLLRFDNGALAYANGNQACPFPLNEFVVYGTEGRIDGRGVTRPMQEGDVRIVTEAGERSHHYSTADAYERLVAAFTQAVAEGRDPNPSGVDGLRSVELVDAITRSAREGLTAPVRPTRLAATA